MNCWVERNWWVAISWKNWSKPGPSRLNLQQQVLLRTGLTNDAAKRARDCSCHVICLIVQRLIERIILQMNRSHSSVSNNILQRGESKIQNGNLFMAVDRPLILRYFSPQMSWLYTCSQFGATVSRRHVRQPLLYVLVDLKCHAKRLTPSKLKQE
jgi:hypothetical protein